MKETKIFKNSEVAQPDSQTEQIIDNLTEKSIETLNQALADKDKIISQLESKLKATETEPSTKIQGILTSQIRSKPSSDTPAMAFLRPTDSQKHSLAECEKTKCQECEIPVIFRVKSKEIIHKDCWTKGNCNGCQKEEIKPKLKKGESVILEGKFASSDRSNRPSFTCYAYEVIQ